MSKISVLVLVLSFSKAPDLRCHNRTVYDTILIIFAYTVKNMYARAGAMMVDSSHLWDDLLQWCIVSSFRDSKTKQFTGRAGSFYTTS